MWHSFGTAKENGPTIRMFTSSSSTEELRRDSLSNPPQTRARFGRPTETLSHLPGTQTRNEPSLQFLHPAVLNASSSLLSSYLLHGAQQGSLPGRGTISSCIPTRARLIVLPVFIDSRSISLKRSNSPCHRKGGSAINNRQFRQTERRSHSYACLASWLTTFT